MGILSGYKKFKKSLRTADGYRLCSEWTNADSVEMADGSTLQESVSALNDEVSSLNEDITALNGNLVDSLGGITFGVDDDGNYGYIKAGADTVTPFSGSNIKIGVSNTNVFTLSDLPFEPNYISVLAKTSYQGSNYPYGLQVAKNIGYSAGVGGNGGSRNYFNYESTGVVFNENSVSVTLNGEYYCGTPIYWIVAHRDFN